jgi:hypothetical protein|tara:strand:- start:732 stop:1115 length:384 start_codon:yes stop_codon:yes gene_type:complete
MRPLFISLLLIIGFNTAIFAQLNEKLLLNKWVDSREELTEIKGQKIFRLSDYKDFPPSRFRQVFEFKKDGICSFLFLSPTDGHYMKAGAWTYDTSTSLITITDEDGKEVYSIEVIELNKDKFVLVLH